MNIVTRRKLQEFWIRHPNAQASLVAWHNHVKAAEWSSPQDIRSADFLADNRVIFNIGGNSYRLVVRISYTYKQVLIKFVGTHAEYDRIDPSTI